MKLQNLFPHMANGSVLVNGRHYELDDRGATKEDVPSEDAQKLLANRAAWRIFVERQAASESVPEKRPITIPEAKSPVPAAEPVAVPPVAEPLPVPEIKPPLGKPGKKR